MRRLGILALLSAAVALALADRTIASPAEQLYPIDLRVNGGEDRWHPHELIQLEWDRPPIADQGFPITAVGYRLRNTAGTTVRETRLTGDHDSVELQVSIPGAYTADVWLEGPGGERGPAVSATLRYDHVRPGLAQPVSPTGWIAGAVAAEVSLQPPAGPLPVSGLRGYAVSVDRNGESWPCAARNLCTDAEIDLQGGPGDRRLSLGNLPEGLSFVNVVAVSGAGIPSADAGSAVLRVDATRPDVSLLKDSDGWASGPVRLAARALDPLSGMAASGPNGAFTALAIDGGVPRVELGGSAAATVSGEGTHQVSAYARDAAGNVGDRAPTRTTVSIDESPPRVAFARTQDPAAPERIEVFVADSLSGADPARGSIAVRAAGTRQPWQPLPTEATPGRLLARWDSDSHPSGSYEFRATGYDAAGNTATSNRRLNGTRMLLANPLKRQVRLQAGFGERGRSTARTVSYGHGSSYAGRLSSARGAPLGRLPVEIVESFSGGAASPQRSTRVLTAADGSFAVRLAPGPSRRVEAVFAGTPTLSRTSGGRVQLDVLAGVRLRASARSARVGGAPVIFSGRVGALGVPIPADGRAVELQFRIPGGEWEEFRTVQTDARGRFRYAYAFSDDDSRGIRFRFRAYISGGGWPYEPAASKSVSVTGR